MMTWVKPIHALAMKSILITTKLGQGYVFTGICDSVHRGGSPAGRTPPWQGDPPGKEVDRENTPGKETPLGRTPPPSRETPQGRPPPAIRSGRYASYWNAFLFGTIVWCGRGKTRA